METAYGTSNIRLELEKRRRRDGSLVIQVGLAICLTALAIITYTLLVEYSNRQVERTVEVLQAMEISQ